MPAITVMMKPSSGMCNMACEYCFYCDELQKREQALHGFMSEETLRNVIRKTMINAEYEVIFAYQGGEPTLRGIDFYKKAVELQKKYNRKNLSVQNVFQTNGLSINDEWCRFFAENNFLVGISVDGIQEVHDAYRHDKNGKGTYQRVIKSIELLKKYGVRYNILTVVNRLVMEKCDQIYEEYRCRGWYYQQYIPCLDPIGEAHSQKEYSIHAEQYGEFLIKLFNHWYRDWKKNRQPYIRQFENYIGILLGYIPEACDQRGSCGIQYVAEADGSVYPCDFYMLDAYLLGNFNTNFMRELDEKRAEINFIQRSHNLDPECKNCQYFHLCKGGCQRYRDRMSESGSYKNFLCAGYKMFFDACMKKMQEIADSLG